MRLTTLTAVLLSLFIIVTTDNGLFDGNKNLSKSQIQRDQQNNPENQKEGAFSGENTPPKFDAYPPLPD
jgi:hypothetical protein